MPTIKQFYIVLFKDGSIQIYRNEKAVAKANFQHGARFFSCDYNTTIEDISDWIARHYNLTAVIKPRKFTFDGETFQRL